jgi:hypothetical protein
VLRRKKHLVGWWWMIVRDSWASVGEVVFMGWPFAGVQGGGDAVRVPVFLVAQEKKQRQKQKQRQALLGVTWRYHER